jgi:thiosulfate/3-mercaptopyruvate sulfurtransferase
MKRLCKLVILSLLMVLQACQSGPTKAISQEPVFPNLEVKGFVGDLLNKGAVILDSRDPFEYGLAHVPGSINIQWQDFTKIDSSGKRVFIDDKFSMARKLSLYGISPETEVLILGNGLDGNGEEGRLAWSLSILGINKIHLLKNDQVRQLNSRLEKDIQNVPIWTPKVNSNLIVNANSFSSLFQVENKPLSDFELYGYSFYTLKNESIVLDVRGEEEQKLNKLKIRSSNKVISKFWKDLFDSKGRPNKESLQVLKNEFGAGKVVFVVSKDGISGAAVTWLLKSYDVNATNLEYGYK